MPSGQPCPRPRHPCFQTLWRALGNAKKPCKGCCQWCAAGIGVLEIGGEAFLRGPRILTRATPRSLARRCSMAALCGCYVVERTSRSVATGTAPRRACVKTLPFRKTKGDAARQYRRVSICYPRPRRRPNGLTMGAGQQREASAMGLAHRISSKGSTSKFSEAVPKLVVPGDYVVVMRGVPRSIVMSCPDGCGEILPINLDRRIGKAWRTYNTGEALTIFPSVWRDTGCCAHFIVWRDQILWPDSLGTTEPIFDEELLSTVLSQLGNNDFTSFETIAEKLSWIPWEVLWACHALVRQRRAIEGKQGLFRRCDSEGGAPFPTGRIDILA